MSKSKPKKESIVIFLAGDLYSLERRYLGNKQLVGTCSVLGSNTYVYSTGKIEWALAAEKDVYVVAQKKTPSEADQWWLHLVPHHHAFFEDEFARSDETLDELTVFPWRNLFLALKISIVPKDRTRALNILRNNKTFLLGSDIHLENS